MTLRPGEAWLKVGIVSAGSKSVDGHESRVRILLVDRKSTLTSERHKSVSAKRKSAAFSASKGARKRSKLVEDISRVRSGFSSRRKSTSEIALAKWMKRRNAKCIFDQNIYIDHSSSTADENRLTSTQRRVEVFNKWVYQYFNDVLREERSNGSQDNLRWYSALMPLYRMNNDMQRSPGCKLA